MDTAQIAMVDFALPKENFKEVDIKSNQKIGLNLENLSRIMSRTRQGEDLLLALDESGNRLGMIAEAGSGTVTGADIHEELGLAMPTLSPKNQKAIADALEGQAMPSLTRQNPVDLGWLDYETSPRLHLQSSRIISEEVDAIVALCYSHLDEDFVTQLTGLRDEVKKPIIVVAGFSFATNSIHF